MLRLFALIHSPLTGPEVWWPVAAQLRSRGHVALVPNLHDSTADPLPYWLQHANSAVAYISAALTEAPTSALVLVAHSGAGQLLGSIGQRLAQAPVAYVFVDAGLPPQQPISRLNQMRAEDEVWASEFEQFLAEGGRFPAWTESDLQVVLSDPVTRRMVVETLRPRGNNYFIEKLESHEALPSMAGAYIQLTPTYRVYAADAAAWGWPVAKISSNHFHMLVDPTAVAAEIVSLAERTGG